MKKCINKRLYFLDLLETIAISLVVVFHGRIYPENILEPQSMFDYLGYYFNTISSVCVPLFFFVNGFLLFNKPFNLKNHLFKILHLIVLVIVWALIKMIVFMIIRGDYLSPFQLLQYAFTWHRGWTNSLWFIGALVCVYLVFPLFKLAYNHNKKVFLFSVIVIVVLTFGKTLINELITIMSPIILKKQIAINDKNFFTMFNPFSGICWYCLVVFCIGGLFYQCFDKIINVTKWKRNFTSIVVFVAASFILMFIGVTYTFANNEIWDITFNSFQSIFSLICTLCVVVLALNYKSNNRLVISISKNTLGIYFIHEFFLAIIIPFVSNIEWCCNWGFSVCVSVVALLLSLLVSMFIDKVPMVNKLVNLK